MPSAFSGGALVPPLPSSSPVPTASLAAALGWLAGWVGSIAWSPSPVHLPTGLLLACGVRWRRSFSLWWCCADLVRFVEAGALSHRQALDSRRARRPGTHSKGRPQVRHRCSLLSRSCSLPPSGGASRVCAGRTSGCSNGRRELTSPDDVQRSISSGVGAASRARLTHVHPSIFALPGCVRVGH